jgi:hypothetical protein
MMRLELVDKYGITNYYYAVSGVMCDEKGNLHIMIMKDSYSYFVHNTQYKRYSLFTEKEDERVVTCLNACKGITTEALENGVIKEAMELFWRVSDKAILNENNQMTYKGNIVFVSDKEVE